MMKKSALRHLNQTIDTIRATVARAKQIEAQDGDLHRQIAHQLPQLHSAIQIAQPDPLEALCAFACDYIDQVPEYLQASHDQLLNLQGGEGCYTILSLASDYFIHPPNCIAHNKGLNELLDEAYLAHRMLEEASDHWLLDEGEPLIPVDMTRANLVVYNLIGAELADQLDHAVLATVDRLVREGTLGQSRSEQALCASRTQECLTEGYGIQIALTTI